MPFLAVFEPSKCKQLEKACTYAKFILYCKLTQEPRPFFEITVIVINKKSCILGTLV
jgi:hypothetical protein